MSDSFSAFQDTLQDATPAVLALMLKQVANEMWDRIDSGEAPVELLRDAAEHIEMLRTVGPLTKRDS